MENNVKINYDHVMQDIISSLTDRKRILLHSCCGPCSSACIERLKDYFDITVIYYNPNIEPLAEYQHRKEEQLRLLNLWHIPHLEVPYNNERFNQITKNLEREVEGGRRCAVCIGERLKYTALKARENKFDYFTTTLSVSPHKNSELINTIGLSLAKHYNVAYLPADFKKHDGFKKSIEYSKKYHLYRQDYCGCRYSKKGTYEE